MGKQLVMPISHDVDESRRRILSAIKSFPTLSDKIYRILMFTLHSKGIVSIEQIQDEALAKMERRAGRWRKNDVVVDDNVPQAHRWDDIERKYVEKSVLEHASRAFSPEEIDDLVNLVRKRDEAQALEEIANLPSVSFRVLSNRLKQFCSLPRGHSRLSSSEAEGVRVALIRKTISDQLEFIGVAKKYLSIRDFEYIVDRMIGDASGMGQIGGKAAGMFLAYRILEKAREEDPSAPNIPILLPDSYFLRSDVVNAFLEKNALMDLQSHKYRSMEEIRNDYPMILEMFKNAEFPRGIAAQLKELLKKIGKVPLIVRSSSLLEDRFGTAFAGKYRSVFLPNQGSLKHRLNELLGAVAEVYASMLHPDPIMYRKDHNLLDYDDHMAVLIQKVVGTKCGDYFLPPWSGVAFSRNEYRWSPRIRREDGLVRIVMGLGTRAVDRVGGDYPRIIALSHPSLKPTATEKEQKRYSQHLVDVINLAENRFETIKVKDLLSLTSVPCLDQIVSIYRDGTISPPLGTLIDDPPENLIVTFDKFDKSPYPAFLKWMLKSLEKAYGVPVDIEFSFDGSNFYLLQCRPQAWRENELTVRVPAGIPAERKIFSADRNVTTGRLHGVEYIVLVDPRDYDKLDTDHERLEIARVIRKLNEKLEGRNFILMGPGRWGSSDLHLGIKVGYADICHARMLIEIARAKGDYVPEVSFGTHFFQDLVEARIHYLPLYPDTPGVVFNEKFLHGSHNVLSKLLPDEEKYSWIVRVVDVPASADGMLLNVDMDGERDEALAYLKEV